MVEALVVEISKGQSGLDEKETKVKKGHATICPLSYQINVRYYSCSLVYGYLGNFIP